MSAPQPARDPRPATFKPCAECGIYVGLWPADDPRCPVCRAYDCAGGAA